MFVAQTVMPAEIKANGKNSEDYGLNRLPDNNGVSVYEKTADKGALFQDNIDFPFRF